MSSQLIRQDLVPIVTGYLLIMGALALGLRMVRRSAAAAAADREPADAADTAPQPGPGTGGAPPATADRGPRGPVAAWRGPGWPRLIRHLAGTAVGGYLLLMAIVLLYYYGVAKVAGSFLESAFTGCALLIGLSAPVFVGASWLAERRDRPPGRDDDGQPAGRT